MTFSNKLIRCHILDRRDQVDQGKDTLKYLAGKTEGLEQAVKDAQKALEDHHRRIANTEKFVKDVEATLDIHWLNDPPY